MFEPLSLKISEQPLLQAEDYLFESFGNFGELKLLFHTKKGLRVDCFLMSILLVQFFCILQPFEFIFKYENQSCESLFFSLLNCKLPLNVGTERKHSNTCRFGSRINFNVHIY